MKLFKKQEKKSSGRKLININALKKGGYLAAVIAVVIAVAIILNVATSLLENRGYLKFDLTPAKSNTLSADNKAFLKSVEREVNITVLCTENEYITTLGEYLQYYHNIVAEEDYYSQTVTLLKQYAEANKKIKVNFIDYSGAQAKPIIDKYPSAFIGDIYVEVDNGSAEKATKLISYDKIYPVSDESGYAQMGYGSYYVDGNDLETALSSAINMLANGEDEILGIINAHTSSDAVAQFKQYLATQLEYNGFSTTEIEGTVLKEIPDDISVLAIVAPNGDFLESEIELINKWLDNDGKKGRSLIFCPGDPIDDYTRLKEFLEEWGVSYGSGYLYQTDSSEFYSDPRIVYSYVNDNDVAAKINDKNDGVVITSYNLPINIAFETFGTRKTNIVTSTSDTATVCPVDAAEDWKPGKAAKKKSYPTVVVTSDTVTVDDKLLSSHVVAFSAFNVIADVGSASFINLDISINTARYVSGMENSAQKLFVTRKLESESFAGEVSEAGGAAITVIFLIVLPLALIALGVVVWVRRRRR